ncbi:MAG: hypothetical protein EOM91_11205 [Sphingobacteriia bacterium]|nr:hypothetical protein [Sphingobacteriia bacterium]NCC40641.1 hypothetical protein [Gammaproteobacteria bacterium]
MNDNAIRLEIRGATLLAVPAVHFRLPFAEAVNAVCRNPSTRPDAIAVELGPAATAAARAWLLELGVGPDRRCRLPCMLGFHREHRLLHPAVRERALALQRMTGSELHRLPPALLKEELDFNGLSVLHLSPTDSIVEALRCACELGVPVYGVDLEESADSERVASLLEDPWLGQGAIADYAVRNARRARLSTNPLIDARREAVMAARLAALLTRHHRVLFTGGLGHWVRLAALLQEPALRPATVGLEADETAIGAWRRTLVHPGIALQHMEWPAVTWLRERNRPHPLDGGPASPCQAPIHQALLGKTLEHVYTRARSWTEAKPGHDWRACSRFAHLLSAESRLALRRIPSLGLVMRCAEAALPTSVSKALGRALVHYPWAKPSQFPGLQCLSGTGKRNGSEVILTGRGGHYRASLAHGGESLTLDPGLLAVADRRWEEGRRSGASGCPASLSWRPWERLATALSARGSGQVSKKKRIMVSEPFSGQLLEGLDVRGTLRELARGRDRLMVRDTRFALQRLRTSLAETFPVLWIFDSDGPRGGRMMALRTLLPWLLDAANDRAALEVVREGLGDNLLDLLLFTDDTARADARETSHGIVRYPTRGWLLLRPQCPSCRQAADWILHTRSRLGPTYGDTLGNEIPNEIRHALGQDGGPPLADLSWQDALLRVGLAFGGKTLTLVAPDDFSPAPAILADAARRGRTIVRVPITSFSNAHVARVRAIEMVPGRVQGDDGRIVYDGQPGDVLGESEDAYRELVPEAWRRYLW